jgi:hypothetical protein
MSIPDPFAMPVTTATNIWQEERALAVGAVEPRGTFARPQQQQSRRSNREKDTEASSPEIRVPLAACFALQLLVVIAVFFRYVRHVYSPEQNPAGRQRRRYCSCQVGRRLDCCLTAHHRPQVPRGPTEAPHSVWRASDGGHRPWRRLQHQLVFQVLSDDAYAAAQDQRQRVQLPTVTERTYPNTTNKIIHSSGCSELYCYYRLDSTF